MVNNNIDIFASDNVNSLKDMFEFLLKTESVDNRIVVLFIDNYPIKRYINIFNDLKVDYVVIHTHCLNYNLERLSKYDIVFINRVVSKNIDFLDKINFDNGCRYYILKQPSIKSTIPLVRGIYEFYKIYGISSNTRILYKNDKKEIIDIGIKNFKKILKRKINLNKLLNR